MKYVVAVSGGVDSVVLLNILLRDKANEIIVAHFEHGIRGESSREDARFVEATSARYGVTCEIGFGNLGAAASEEVARIKRYEFLKNIALKHNGKLVTAHHQDDLLESIAINLIRGTGWRGLAVFGDASIERPLLSMKKDDIYRYALAHNLEWVEDETNATDTYLRNRVRRKLHLINDSSRQKIVELYAKQIHLVDEINELNTGFPRTSRYFLTVIDESVALELLRALLTSKNLSLTRPQRQRLLLAVKTAKPGSIFQAGGNVTAQFTLREFIVN